MCPHCRVWQAWLKNDRLFFQGIVRRTWHRGNNDEFLGRAIKYAQRRKWSSLLKAFHTAIGKVCLLQSGLLSWEELQHYSCQMSRRLNPVVCYMHLISGVFHSGGSCGLPDSR